MRLRMSSPQFAERVRAAHSRIRDAVCVTPLEPAAELAPAGVHLFCKMENLQETGSFKLRGASSKLLAVTAEQRAKGVIAASNGNHGMGVAAAARRLHVDAEIFVSSHVSTHKAAKIESYGARLCRAGDDPLAAELAARAAAESSGKVFVSPYNDLDVMAGQGSIAVEVLEQLGHLDAVFVAVGGGGLIGGIGAFLKHASPRTEIVGCWAANSPVMYECMKAGKIINVAEQPTLSTSTAGNLEPGSVTLEVCRAVIDRPVLVSEEEIASAMRMAEQRRGWKIEGAAGVALAAFRHDPSRYAGKNVVVVICGGNL